MKTMLRYAAVLTLAVAGVFGWANTALAQEEPPPAETAYANAIVCADPDCADLENVFGMEGASITSLDATGAVIDSCTVVAYPSGMDGCDLIPHAGDGFYEVVPTDEYAGYTLLSAEPEVLESESHGIQLNWYFAPTADEVPPEDDDITPPDDVSTPPADGDDPVTGLPDTGTGPGSRTGLLAGAAVGAALIAAGATGIRKMQHR